MLHFATKIPPLGRITRRNFAENDRLRRDGSRCLVDAALAAGVTTYVQESVAFLYVDGGDSWLDEATPLHTSWGSESTVAAERETARFAASGGRGVVLRYGLFYAPHAPSTVDSVRLARRGLFPVLGAGTQAFRVCVSRHGSCGRSPRSRARSRAGRLLMYAKVRAKA